MKKMFAFQVVLILLFFSGFYFATQVNQEPVNFTQRATMVANIDVCTGLPCQVDQCQNGATCIPTGPAEQARIP